ncbi:MAG: acyl-CoA dehydrogenase family protein [Noviherbaspirillum sp.]
MDFDQGEEQAQLADSVARYLEREYGFEARMEMVRSDAPRGGKAWERFAEMGLLGLPFAEEHGGFGWGATGMMGVMQAMGAALVLEPYVATVGLAGRLVSRAGSAEQKAALLPAIVEGRLSMAFAHVEQGARYVRRHVATRATAREGGWRMDGRKVVALHAPCADRIVVSARTAGADGDAEGISLFLLDPGMPGIARKPYRTVDGMPAADIEFAGLEVPASALLGEAGAALPLIDEAMDFATALLAAEAVGVMKYAQQETLEYLKTRKQFGVALGSFQALQHRMVDMMISCEQAYSMACLAAVKADSEADPAARARAISAAQIRIADACRQIRHESVQMHGGIGMTEEMKLSHAFRRLMTIAQQCGDTAYHLERYAALS